MWPTPKLAQVWKGDIAWPQPYPMGGEVWPGSDPDAGVCGPAVTSSMGLGNLGGVVAVLMTTISLLPVSAHGLDVVALWDLAQVLEVEHP